MIQNNRNDNFLTQKIDANFLIVDEVDSGDMILIQITEMQDEKCCLKQHGPPNQEPEIGRRMKIKSTSVHLVKRTDVLFQGLR